MNEKVIIDGCDVSGCKYRVCHYIEDEDVEINDCWCLTYTPCNYEKKDCYYKQLQQAKEENEELKKENEEINSRMSDVIYRATGGRLCYSTYTLDAIEHAFQDQLEILSDRKAEDYKFELEKLHKKYEELHIKYAGCKTANTAIQEENEGLKSTIDFYVQKIETLEVENERLKVQIERKRETCTCQQCYDEGISDATTIARADINKLHKALEEIRDYLQQFKKKKSNFYTLNYVITDIANNIEKVINEVLKEGK